MPYMPFLLQKSIPSVLVPLSLREFNYGSPLEMVKRDTNRVNILIATMVGT